MTRRRRIDLLLDYVETVQHPLVRQEYARGVAARSLPRFLPIQVKNLCENLRSALDYLAHEIWDAYGDTSASKPKIYFPIRRTPPEFASVVAALYPRLANGNSELYRLLECIQPYPGSKDEWLGEFNKLNNDNKHLDLAPQTVHSAPMTSDPRAGGLGPVFIADDAASEWVEFRFPGITRNAHHLIDSAVVGVRYICNEVIDLLQ